MHFYLTISFLETMLTVVSGWVNLFCQKAVKTVLYSGNQVRIVKGTVLEDLKGVLG